MFHVSWEMTKEELWKAVLGEIELVISKANFVTWFRDTKILSRRGGEVLIGVPNGFTKEWLENKYNKHILTILKNLERGIKTVKYMIKEGGRELILPSIKKQDKKRISKKEIKIQPLFDEYKINKETSLNQKYTFDSFVVGSFNELAHAAAWAVTKKPGLMYNPFFIYGGVGLGKTHLLQAIGNEIVGKQPQKRVRYLPSEKFTTELVNSIQEKAVNTFKEKYRKIDVLIIDDVQFIAGKEKTQEEFFHIFNSLYEKNKQIILSSDRPPQAISTLEERLRSRFEGGMIADIGYPDFETRVAILKIKAQEKEISLSEEIYSYIAENVHKNIRELEGALNRLVASVSLNGGLNLEEAQKILCKLFSKNQRKISYKDILKTVAEFYDISEGDILSPTRKKEIVWPRQLVMYLMREELKTSYPFIGLKLGGKDHTTVMHACEKVGKKINENESLNETLSLIKERVYGS